MSRISWELLPREVTPAALVCLAPLKQLLSKQNTMNQVVAGARSCWVLRRCLPQSELLQQQQKQKQAWQSLQASSSLMQQVA